MRRDCLLIPMQIYNTCIAVYEYFTNFFRFFSKRVKVSSVKVSFSISVGGEGAFSNKYIYIYIYY